MESNSPPRRRHDRRRSARRRRGRSGSGSTTASLPDDRFLDRELSWLAFNQRVLELAEDDTLPLLERANFLAIFASNLDEFFMVRVAGLKRRIATGLAVPTNVGRAPVRRARRHQREGARAAGAARARLPRSACKPALDEAGIHIEGWRDLEQADRDRIDEIFSTQIFPVLMPLAVDPAHPFPYISGLSLNLSIRVRNPKTQKVEFARLKMPQNLARFVKLPDDDTGPPALHPARGPHLEPPRRAVPRHGDPRAPRVPRHPQRGRRDRGGRHRDRSSRRSRRSCCAAASARRSGSRSPTTWTT